MAFTNNWSLPGIKNLCSYVLLQKMGGTQSTKQCTMRMCPATLEMQPTERDKEASISKMVNTMSLGCYRETEHAR